VFFWDQLALFYVGLISFFIWCFSCILKEGNDGALMGGFGELNAVSLKLYFD
jgi:hypothetical protein